MKKFLISLIGLFCVIFLLGFIVVFIFWSRLPDIVATNLSEKMKVPVQIDSFGVRWNKIDAKKIQIGNLPHSILPKSFSCNEVDVFTPLTHFLNQKIVIDQIDLKNIYLGLEFDSATSTNGNWTQILKNLNTSIAKEKNDKKEKAPTTKKKEHSLLIHRVILTNIDIDVVYKKEKGKVKKLPRIPRMELTEISSEGGIPTEQILNSVLGEMLKEVFIKENLKNMLKEFMDTPSPLQPYLSPFKGFFNTAPQEIHKESSNT